MVTIAHVLATVDPGPREDAFRAGLEVGLIVAFAVIAAYVGALLWRRILGV